MSYRSSRYSRKRFHFCWNWRSVRMPNKVRTTSMIIWRFSCTTGRSLLSGSSRQMCRILIALRSERTTVRPIFSRVASDALPSHMILNKYWHLSSCRTFLMKLKSSDGLSCLPNSAISSLHEKTDLVEEHICFNESASLKWDSRSNDSLWPVSTNSCCKEWNTYRSSGS